MCRLLAVRDQTPFSIEPYLDQFAEICENSKEYQGHGWGFAKRVAGKWSFHRDITPIWEADLSRHGEAEVLLVHARSAFNDEGIVVENNMPFNDDERVFIFNGELRGVRIASEGRIGAEKIFNFIKRFDRGSLESALQKGTDIIKRRTRYLRAMNIIMAQGDRLYLSSNFSEDPDYFTLYQHNGPRTMFCSQPLGPDWKAIPNQSLIAC